jgi:class 3 adenylate cyclase
MNETRKLPAILAADVVGFSRLAGADEDRTLARLRALRSDLIDPTIAVQRGGHVRHKQPARGKSEPAGCITKIRGVIAPGSTR